MVQLGVEEAWSYTYQVSWCAEGSEIVSGRPDGHPRGARPGLQLGRQHRGVGDEVPGRQARTAFNLSEFSCPADIGTKGVNPWAIINLRADGTYTIDATGIKP